MVYIGLIIQWTNIGLSYPKGRFIAGPVMVAQWKSWRTIIKNTFIVITEAYKLCFLGLRVKISIARPTINWPYLWQIPMLYKCSSSLHAPPPIPIFVSLCKTHRRHSLWVQIYVYIYILALTKVWFGWKGKAVSPTRYRYTYIYIFLLVFIGLLQTFKLRSQRPNCWILYI